MLWSFQHTVNKDILRYRDWAMIPYTHSLTDPYEGKYITFGIAPLNMPPGTLYLLTGMYRVNITAAKVIYKLTHTPPGALQWVNNELTNAFLRLPNIAADLLVGYLIYALVRKKRNEKSALVASGLYLFNPGVWYNSSFWGQMDAVNGALCFLGVYLLLTKRRTLGVISLFLSLYVKLTLIFVIGPLLGLVWLWEKKKAQVSFAILGALALILFFTLPISRNPISWFLTFFGKNGLGEMHNITSLAFNFWWVVVKPKITIGKPFSDFEFTLDTFSGSPESSVLWFGIPLFAWAILLFVIAALPLVRVMMKLKTRIFDPANLILWLSMLTLVAYLFLPHMHERYLFIFFPLMATYIGLTGKHLREFIVLSILNFLNLYIVWHPMVNPSLPYAFMNSIDVQWWLSVCTVLVGLIVYKRGIGDAVFKQKSQP